MATWRYDGVTPRRRSTRTVHVGDVAVGSRHPIRVQSMTTPATRDVLATVNQIERLVEAGCEIVRVTVPTTSDAESLPDIRREMARRRVRVPLVADIHFTPAAAMKAVEHVEKIRINPGNYADKKRFAVREYSDAEYDRELQRIAEVVTPLVLRARELGVSMRIGTNHGSLSDRIMNRYGDTPEGMVESALEFVRICERHDYRELILSMKSSNPVVVQQVYRLLAQRMADEGMDYPFHLGVTEAGDGEDARIKSALGIGTLLAEGLGDTIRVSLTEDPVAEIPVARKLVEQCRPEPDAGPTAPPVIESRDPFSYARRVARTVAVGPQEIGGAGEVRVEVPLASGLDDPDAVRREIDRQAGVRVPAETRAEGVVLRLDRADQRAALAALRHSLELVAPRVALAASVDAEWLVGEDDASLARWVAAAHRLDLRLPAPLDAPLRDLASRLMAAAADGGGAVAFELGATDGAPESAVRLGVELAREDAALPRPVLTLAMAPEVGPSPLKAYRRLAARLSEAGLEPPLLLVDDPAARGADELLAPSTALGGLLCDGAGDAIRLRGYPGDEARRLAFGILQAARIRITRTEFISCPSCGRTLFDLEETTARIKRRTAHLKGVKIAVMGCIVNGPGEMADADFGYVGWGEDKIALFVGKDMVAKDIPTAEADERLVQLIREHGRWVDPQVVETENA